MNAWFYIDAICDAGFAPAEEVEGLPGWFADRYEAARLVDGHPDLVLGVNHHEDELTLTLVRLPGGLISELLRFSAPDEHMTPRAVDAFGAVADAWGAA